jgi:hypothetical protein
VSDVRVSDGATISSEPKTQLDTYVLRRNLFFGQDSIVIHSVTLSETGGREASFRDAVRDWRPCSIWTNQRCECNCEKDNLARCQRLAAEGANHM